MRILINSWTFLTKILTILLISYFSVCGNEKFLADMRCGDKIVEISHIVLYITIFLEVKTFLFGHSEM